MEFRGIELEDWDRKEYYLHYMNCVPCTYSMCVDLDITVLDGRSLYPSLLWAITDTVNQYEAFRTHLSSQGLGIFSDMCPKYTIFNRETSHFSSIWTEFDPDPSVFLQRYRADLSRYGSCACLFHKKDEPANTFDISMRPWASFTAFNLNIPNGAHQLLPIFTLGKTFERDGKTLIPLAIQVHHAVCDGYHVCRFVTTLQNTINSCFPRQIG